MYLDTAITEEPLEGLGGAGTTGVAPGTTGVAPGTTGVAPGAGLPPIPAASGARLTFWGCVRDNANGRGVAQLTYTAHPEAAAFLERTVQKVAAGFPLQGVFVRHRVGTLRVGEAALVVVVDMAHRGEGFEALPAIVDAIKAEVPIWKEEHYTDGEKAWPGSPA